MKSIERQHQIAVVQYLQMLEKTKMIETFFCVPNGGSRNKIEASNLKKEGVRSGVSDLIVIFKEKVLFLEMKQPKKVLKSGKLSNASSKQSPSQIEFMNSVTNSNVCIYDVGYGFAGAKIVIDKYIK